MLQLYNSTQAQAVLTVSSRESSRKLLFDQNMQLKAWQNIQTHEIKNPTGIPIQQLTAWAFAGLHVINTAFIKSWALTGKFSIIDLYLNQCAQHLIIGIDAANHYWWDIGTPQKLKNAQLFFENNK